MLFISCGRLINNSTYCPAVNVCSFQHQSFVQVPSELLQSVESRCGAVAVGWVCLLPPLSSGGAQVT